MYMYLFLRLYPLVMLSIAIMPPLWAHGQARSDTTFKDSQSDFMFLADTLAAQYAAQERLTPEIPRDSGTHGFLRFERTLIPLRHVGANVFQPFLEDQNFRNIVRTGKDNPDWHPLLPELVDDYHYDQGGNTKHSQTVSVSLKQRLQAQGRVGYQLDGRYIETGGPYPNQQTTRFEMLSGLTVRVNPKQTVSIKLLGFDHGWHIRRNNTIYTDRARYILDDINPWRARSGGLEFSTTGQVSASGSYQVFLRVLIRQGANEPENPQRLQPPANITSPVFIDGFLPTAMAAAFSSHRTYQTYKTGANFTFAEKTSHEISVGIETAYHDLSHREFWRPAVVPFEFDLSLQPRELGVFLQNRFRFGDTVMNLGLRYDGYDPGTTRWRDIYQTLGDNRVFQNQTRQQLLTSAGSAAPIHLISPSFSIAYPSDRITAHMTFSAAYQSADLEALYSLADSAPSGYTTRSNTQLHPQRKTTLEAGVGLYGRRLSLDVTAFYRNGERYVPVFGPDVLPQAQSNYSGYWGRVNAGFQRQGGMEMILIRPSSPMGKSRVRFSGRLSYLYLKDLGVVQLADRSIQPGMPIQPGDYTTFDRRINRYWNRRHWISANSVIRFPAGFVITTVGHLQSGVPYRSTSRVHVGETVNVDQDLPVGFGPWHIRFDSRIDIPITGQSGRIKPTMFIEIRNLLDRKNVDRIPDPRLFESTGLPDNQITDQRQWVYGPTRAVWAGFGFRW